MPQMTPLPWLFLMAFFIITLMLIIMQIYHNFPQPPPKISMQLSIKNKTWMW